MSPPAFGASRPLPPGKLHHFFLSHKKAHSTSGKVPEQVAKNFHDSLELLGFSGWFDIDDLKRIAKEDLRAALSQCCSVIILMNDETPDSEFCRYEWQCASELGLPCKVIVDMERASKAALLGRVNHQTHTQCAAHAVPLSSSPC